MTEEPEQWATFAPPVSGSACAARHATESGLQDNLDAFVQTGEIKSAPPVSDFVDTSVIADATK